MLPLGILAILQYFSPPTSPLNAYAQEAAEWGVATFGDEVKRARITGTFSYIAGLTTYLYVVFSLLLAFSAVNLPGKFKIGVNICLVLCVASMLMSGSRSNFLYVAIILCLAAWFMRSGSSRLSSALPRIIFGLLIAGLAGKFIFGDAVESIAGRAGGDSLVERLALVFEPVVNAEDYDLFGFGVGTTHPARAQLEEMFNLPPAPFKPAGAEVEPLQTIQEMGHLGFLTWMALKLTILAQLYRCTEATKRPFLKMLAVMALSFHISHIYLSTIANHIAGLYYWFFASFIFLLPRIEKIQRARNWGIRMSRSRSRLQRRKRMSTQAVPEIPLNTSLPKVVCKQNGD
jgi:O-antigen ligase